MFTGIVEACVPLLSLERRDQGARLRIAAPRLAPDAPPWDPRLGESLAVSGCCLSLVEAGADGSLAFDLSAETLARTWFAEAEPGRSVNLERALRLSDRLGGHLVSGHVDGLGRIVSLAAAGDGGRLLSLEVPAGFERYLIEKGSLCVDGISLTVVAPHGRRCEVALVPETLARTSLGRARAGLAVHLEADLVGKWIERLLRRD